MDYFLGLYVIFNIIKKGSEIDGKSKANRREKANV